MNTKELELVEINKQMIGQSVLVVLKGSLPWRGTVIDVDGVEGFIVRSLEGVDHKVSMYDLRNDT